MAVLRAAEAEDALVATKLGVGHDLVQFGLLNSFLLAKRGPMAIDTAVMANAWLIVLSRLLSALGTLWSLFWSLGPVLRIREISQLLQARIFINDDTC